MSFILWLSRSCFNSEEGRVGGEWFTINNCNSSYQKYLKAKYHFENSSGSKYIATYQQSVVKLDLAWREKSSKNSIYWQTLCIVHCSFIIFQSIKVWNPSIVFQHGWSQSYYQIGIEYLIRVGCILTCNCLERDLFWWKFALTLISVVAALDLEFEWKGNFKSCTQLDKWEYFSIPETPSHSYLDSHIVCFKGNLKKWQTRTAFI